MYQLLSIKFCKNAKSLVVELIPPHVQSAWRFRGERVRIAGLTTCCNYFSKKKKLCKIVENIIHKGTRIRWTLM